MWNINNIKTFHNLLKQEISRAANETLDNFSNGVKKEIANTKEFGGSILKNSVNTKNSSNGSTHYASVSIDGEAAVNLEKGTKPHKIAAKEGSLKFEVNNETVYVKEVYHPGTKPTNFFTKACEKESSKLEENMIRKMIEISK
jgi:hypothetical protein